MFSRTGCFLLSYLLGFAAGTSISILQKLTQSNLYDYRIVRSEPVGVLFLAEMFYRYSTDKGFPCKPPIELHCKSESSSQKLFLHLSRTNCVEVEEMGSETTLQHMKFTCLPLRARWLVRESPSFCNIKLFPSNRDSRPWSTYSTDHPKKHFRTTDLMEVPTASGSASPPGKVWDAWLLATRWRARLCLQ